MVNRFLPESKLGCFTFVKGLVIRGMVIMEFTESLIYWQSIRDGINNGLYDLHHSIQSSWHKKL